jgi:hypothetical protein
MARKIKVVAVTAPEQSMEVAPVVTPEVVEEVSQVIQESPAPLQPVGVDIMQKEELEKLSDSGSLVDTEELDRLVAEHHKSRQAAKKADDKMTCPDCGKQVTKKTMRYSHKKFCKSGTPAVEPVPTPIPEPAPAPLPEPVPVPKAKTKTRAVRIKKEPEILPIYTEEAPREEVPTIMSLREALDGERRVRQIQRKERIKSLFGTAI